MELDDHFARIVNGAIEELWEASIVMRVTRCCWTQTKYDAVCFCIEHERFCERHPRIARYIHRAIDIYGKNAVVTFLADRVDITLNPMFHQRG